MKRFMTVSLFMAAAVAAGATEPAVSQNGPYVKNLMAPTYRFSAAPVAAPHQLTKREVNRLAATAESAADHLNLARYFIAEADKLDARATAYEQAAATYRHGPYVKNLMAPTTLARYEYSATEFRKEAISDRALAVSHEQMAKSVSASL